MWFLTLSTPFHQYFCLSRALLKPAVWRCAQSLKSRLLQSFSAILQTFLSLNVTHSHTFSLQLTEPLPLLIFGEMPLNDMGHQANFLRLSAHLNCQPQTTPSHMTAMIKTYSLLFLLLYTKAFSLHHYVYILRLAMPAKMQMNRLWKESICLPRLIPIASLTLCSVLS